VTYHNVPPDCERTVAASFEAVTACLISLRAAFRALHLPAAHDDGWEIVLAEACNNVVEHALAGQPDAAFDLAVWLHEHRMVVRLTDRGRPMPGGLPPRAKTGPPGDPLPEGGFGWTMIHGLCADVRYSRAGGENRLDLVIPIASRASPASRAGK
jgi:serine/threonine-protein kinase RsbW